MQTTPRTTRQALGCGYEPPGEGMVRPWDHPGREIPPDEIDDHGQLIDPTCPGYLCGLPEVIETSHARLHWQKSQLAVYTRRTPRPELITAITVLEIESGRCDAWDFKNGRKERS